MRIREGHYVDVFSQDQNNNQEVTKQAMRGSVDDVSSQLSAVSNGITNFTSLNMQTRVNQHDNTVLLLGDAFSNLACLKSCTFV